MPLVAGVELGGTKCIGTLGRGPGDVVDQWTIPTRHPGETLPLISAKLRRWHDQHGFGALGIAAFGPLDLRPLSQHYGMVGATAKPGWTGARVLDEIAGALSIPVRLDSDVNGAARAEQRWGTNGGTSSLAYVTIGTGIGVGFARVDNLPPPDHHAELGHLRVVRHPEDPQASVCPFHADCVEGLASGRAITARFGGLPDTTNLSDPRWVAPIDYLGQLCHFIMLLGSVDRIVFGGGAIIGNPQLIVAAETAMRHSLNGCLALDEGTQVLGVASLGNDAGPLGSLALARDALQSRQSIHPVR